MLNIVVQCCSLAMLLILICIFAFDRSLSLSSRVLYFRTLLACTVCLMLDISSIVAIAAATNGTFSASVTKVICKLYVMSLLLQTFAGFRYASGEFFSGGARSILKRFYEIWFVVGVSLIGLLPINFFMEGRIVYSYGPSTIATYVFTIVYIVSSIIMAFLRSEHASVRRRRAILLWLLSWLVAALIQLLNPEILVVGFAAAFGMMILYAELENPHEGIDRMTGHYTHNALMDYVKDQYQSRSVFATVYILIEYINPNVDYDTQETILIRAANFLSESKGANIFRYSDTEFVLIYNDEATMESDYQRIALSIDDAIDLPVRIKYIVMPDSSLVEQADEYFRFFHYFTADLEDKECVIIDEAAVDRIRDYTRVKELIQSALDDNRVEVYYQPFYNVKEDKFTSAEALVRIKDKNGALVPPGVFIPIAEENGLIIPLGEEIFRQVCEFLSSGEPQEHGIEYIEYNLSVAQFDQDNLADVLMMNMEKYNVNPKNINLEITETASTGAKQILLRNMRRLMAHEVRFSLDDFGTGRSNLDYFVEMPVDIIKFDYTFTQSYFTSEKAKYVMESVINMFHKMNLQIVSEGVETDEQLEAMKALGVEYIQGFYFSQPLSRKEFIAFLRSAKQ